MMLPICSLVYGTRNVLPPPGVFLLLRCWLEEVNQKLKGVSMDSNSLLGILVRPKT